nr:hypothetical protein [Tanacetum cinerariifolium]
NASTNVVNAPREPYVVKHQNSLNDSPSISETFSQSPPNINQCCYECGDPLDGIFCKCCTCKSCGKDAHVGYNFPSNVSVIFNPEPCNNQTIDELPQMPSFHSTFHSDAESPFTLDSTPTYVDESPNIFNPPPQPSVYPCEFCGNDAYYGHYCTHQAPFIYPEPCYNQDFNFPQNFQDVPQQYPSIYLDHPIFNAHNSYLDSQIQLNSTLAKIKDQMTSITSLCELACQVAQKKLEEKQIEEERVAKANYWKLPELDNSLSIGDEHLDTIPATESDEFIKSGVENLIPIPSESEGEGIPEHVCDVPSHDISPPLDVSKDQIEDFFESNKEFSSIDDDSFSIDDIDYVDASPPDSELVSSEVIEIVIPETKSSSTSLNSLLEETNTFDNSLPEFETFCFDVKEISSGSTTTHLDISLPEYEAFHDYHVKEFSSGSPTTHSDSPIYASFMFDLSINPFPPADMSDSYEFTDELIPFISALEYDCFRFTVEPNSRDFTKDVVEDISAMKEPQVLNALPTHPTLQLNISF